MLDDLFCSHIVRPTTSDSLGLLSPFAGREEELEAIGFTYTDQEQALVCIVELLRVVQELRSAGPKSEAFVKEQLSQINVPSVEHMGSVSSPGLARIDRLRNERRERLSRVVKIDWNRWIIRHDKNGNRIAKNGKSKEKKGEGTSGVAKAKAGKDDTMG